MESGFIARKSVIVSESRKPWISSRSWFWEICSVQLLNYVEERSLRPATLREAPCNLKLLEHSVQQSIFGFIQYNILTLVKLPSINFHAQQCTKCENSHVWVCTNRSKAKARWCQKQDCCQFHQAKDGDGWVEYKGSLVFDRPQKVEIPRAFVCAESKIFDVSEWAICQGMAYQLNLFNCCINLQVRRSKVGRREVCCSSG